MTQDDQLVELETRKAELVTLVQSDGWKAVTSFFQSLKVSKRNQIFAHSEKSLDSLIDLSAQKSELAGMEFMYSTPYALIEEIDMEIATLREEMQDDNQ